jgi:[acyl-carrier-protein] S-malonyltransferase
MIAIPSAPSSPLSPNPEDPSAPKRPWVLALFPGQGSQYVGMGKSLYENFSSVRNLFEEGSDTLHLNLKKLCFEGPESDLTLTENTQPCLLTVSVAAFQVAESELRFQPDCVAGHSLGEYSALVAAGSLPFAAAIRWVRERGLAMQRAVPVGAGSMAAILGLEDEAVTALCQKATVTARQFRIEHPESPESALQVPALVEPANYNSPGQVVIAGSTDALQAAAQCLSQDPTFQGGKFIPLPVSAPFHSALMAPARTRMAQLFTTSGPEAHPRVPRFPYVPNRTARAHRVPEAIFDLLIEQMDHPVLWKQGMSGLLEQSEVRTQGLLAVEFGAGKVLSGLLKRIAAPFKIKPELHSFAEKEHLKALEAALPAELALAPHSHT